MEYEVVLTDNAAADLDAFLLYILREKQNPQAVQAILDDYEQTIQVLSRVVTSLKLCDNPRLKELGYHRINFISHRYFMLYRVEHHTVYVDNIFHELQDYANIIS